MGTEVQLFYPGEFAGHSDAPFQMALRRKIEFVEVSDIDYFKQVNDTFGHDMGDDVLQAITEVVKKTFASLTSLRAGAARSS
jgi:diguanylate cyclase (GGDEF)-like protein